MSAFGPLISAEGLWEILSAPDVKVLDGSWHLPAAGRDPHTEYLDVHIPGAVFFDIDAVSDPASDLPHMLPSAADFSEALSAMGVTDGDRVVVYDSVGLFSAPRVWWMLRAFGCEAVAVLDGGLPAWRAAGGPVASGPENPKRGAFSARLQQGAVADAADVLAATQTPGACVIDARAPDRFAGEAPKPRPGLRSGHIPTSRNAPYSGFVCDGRMAAPEEIAARFAEAGVPEDADRLIVSCGSGVSAAVLYLGLTLTGRTGAALYDGSWSEWGGREDLPIETGPARP